MKLAKLSRAQNINNEIAYRQSDLNHLNAAINKGITWITISMSAKGQAGTRQITEGTIKLHCHSILHLLKAGAESEITRLQNEYTALDAEPEDFSGHDQLALQ